MVDNIWVRAMCCRRKIGGSFMWRDLMKAMCDSTCNLVVGCRSLRTRIRTERLFQFIKNGQQETMFLFDNRPQRSFWSLMNTIYWRNNRIAIRLSIYTFTFFFALQNINYNCYLLQVLQHFRRISSCSLQAIFARYPHHGTWSSQISFESWNIWTTKCCRSI